MFPFCPGESLPLTTASTLLENMPSRAKLVNGYGPAECTLCSTNHTVTKDDVKNGSIPIGQPDPAHQCVIYEENFQPVSSGEIGELFVGGQYINKERRRKQKKYSS